MGPILDSNPGKKKSYIPVHATVLILDAEELLLSWSSFFISPFSKKTPTKTAGLSVTNNSLSFLAATLYFLSFSKQCQLWLCFVVLVCTLVWWCDSLLLSSMWHGSQCCSVGRLKKIWRGGQARRLSVRNLLCEVLSSCCARKWHLWAQLVREWSFLHVEIIPGDSLIGSDACWGKSKQERTE